MHLTSCCIGGPQGVAAGPSKEHPRTSRVDGDIAKKSRVRGIQATRRATHVLLEAFGRKGFKRRLRMVTKYLLRAVVEWWEARTLSRGPWR